MGRIKNKFRKTLKRSNGGGRGEQLERASLPGIKSWSWYRILKMIEVLLQHGLKSGRISGPSSLQQTILYVFLDTSVDFV